MADTRKVNSGHRGAAVFICTISTFLVNIDNTSYQVAAPTIVRELNSPLSAIPWILGSYTLSLASLELYAGWLGDRVGRKRLLMWGLFIYIIGSVATALVNETLWLIASRALAGVGGAALVPMGLAIVRLLSSDDKQLQRYTSLWGIAVGAGMALGPLAGGLFASQSSWRMLPVTSAVIALAFLCSGAIVLSPDRDESQPAETDYIGLNLLILTSTLVTLAILLHTSDQHLAARMLGILALVIGVGLTARIKFTGNDPLPMPGRRGRLFTPILVIASLNYLGLGAGIAVMSVGILQVDSSVSAGRAGILLVPLAFGYAFGSRVITAFVDRYSNGLAIALSCIAGLITTLLAMVFIRTDNAEYLVPAIAASLGMSVGAINTPTNSLAMSQVPREAAGLAGAFASTARQIGQGLGISIAGGAITYHAKGTTSTLYMWTPLSIAFVTMAIIGAWILCVTRESHRKD